MHQGIRIGMADQSAPVRDPHAAERDVIAFAEGVDIEPGAGAQVGEHHLGLGAREIVWRGQLDVGDLAFEHRNLDPHPFDEYRIVAEAVMPLGCSTPVGVSQAVAVGLYAKL